VADSDDSLLEAIYEGPLEDPPWEGFLEALRVRMGAIACTLLVRSRSDPGVGLTLSRGRRNFESAYTQTYFTSDPFVNLPEGEVMTLDDVVPRAELEASAFYRQLLEPAGVRAVIGIDLRAGDELEARLRITRGPGEPEFGGNERRCLAALAPHLRRALRLYARLTHVEGQRDVYADAVDHLAVGTILLDEGGRVLQTNAAAARLSEAGIGIVVRDGRIAAAAGRADDRRLREAIERALALRLRGGPALVEALRLDGGAGPGSVGALVRPLPVEPEAAGRARPAVAIFVGDPAAAAEIPSEVVRGLFDLTQAEATLAVRLAAGATLDEVAAELGIARNTARAHLRAIFDKAGVARQAELVRLILRSVATLGAG